MSRRGMLLIWCVLGTVLPVSASAQADQIAAGIRETAAHDLPAARRSFEAALRHDPSSYEATWRLALTLTDIAKQTPDHLRSPARDSMYHLAESYARRAVTLNPHDAEGHFVLADALGRSLLSMSPREKVKRATEVRDEAIRATELNPRHDGAWHILGRWNAEAVRLPAIEKFFARTFLGASVLNSASWDEAEKDLRIAVTLAPATIVHRFDLAEILVWRQKWAEANVQLDLVESLPVVDISDPSYKEQARVLQQKVAEKLKR